MDADAGGEGGTQHDTAPIYVELNLRSNVELVSVVRRFVLEFNDRLFVDDDATARVALAAHELLENAMRYSRDGETRIRIELDGNRPIQTVAIATWNNADREQIEVLGKLFKEMHSAPEPFAFYQELMRRNAKLPDRSGLGLARVRAEAEMEVSWRVDGDQVHIVARASVPNGRAPGGSVPNGS